MSEINIKIEEKYDPGNEHILYILVDTDLKMGKGKITAQACHSFGKVLRVLERLSDKNQLDKQYKTWLDNAEPIVVLKSNNEQMKQLLADYRIRDNTKLEDVWCVEIIDAGRTQIAPGSMTTLTFRPMPRSSTPEIIKSLKLL